jgi:hypothetical protein
VNWTVVGMVGFLTLGIGVAIVLFTSGGGHGGIVVPQPGPPPAATPRSPTGSSIQIESAAGSVRPTTTPRSTTRATTLPGSNVGNASTRH